MRRTLVVALILGAVCLRCSDSSDDSEDRPGLPQVPHNGGATQVPAGTIRINVPYFGSGEVAFGQCAIFWFGQVRMTENYADVRIGYNNWELYVYVAVFDRRIWFDENPAPTRLTRNDALTLLLATEENPTGISSKSFMFIAQMSGDSAARYRRTMIGTSEGLWRDTALPIVTIPGWRGDALNNNGDDRGWAMTFRIPFSSLGLTAVPPGGTVWRMGLVLHDRDDTAGTPIAPMRWPNDSVGENSPATWGQISFGLARYVPPSSAVSDSFLIRDRHQGLEVKEIAVGGSSVCGDGRDFFSQWGDMNDPVNRTLVVQNQADIADWPCFSKVFFAFPLTTIPRDRAVHSATLTIYLFGGSDPSQAKPSWIQALIVSPWDSATTTWNNSPVVLENCGGTWVMPCRDFPGWPGIRYQWDISYAVAQALASHKDTLYLGLYSADSDYHSGKYFVGSTDDGWNEQGRPAVLVRMGSQ